MLIDTLSIVNYREAAGKPLRSITRLPRDEAYALAARLSAGSKAEKDRYGAHFDYYYPRRLKTEEWLYSEFTRQGGKPLTRHPVYFVLEGSAYLRAYFGVDDETRLPLAGIRSEHVSFTPRDSMHLMDLGKTDGALWRKQELEDRLLHSGMSAAEFIRHAPREYFSAGGYIEVQLWSDEYISALL